MSVCLAQNTFRLVLLTMPAYYNEYWTVKNNTPTGWESYM